MGISQIVLIAIISVLLIMVVKTHAPIYGFLIRLTVGLLIFVSILPIFADILEIFNDIATAINNNAIIEIILKIICVAYIAEIGVQICKDAGEESIANKVEIAAKFMIFALSMPIMIELINIVTIALP